MERYTYLTKEKLLNFIARVNEQSVAKKLTFLNSDGTGHDITGYDFEFLVKKSPYSRTNIFRLTVGDGLEIGGADDNELTIVITDTRATQQADVYFCQLRSQDEDHTWLDGDFQFIIGKNDTEEDEESIIIYQNGGDVTIVVEGASGGGGGAWGEITGTLSDQTDLQAALDAKQPAIQFQEEGVNLGNTEADTVDFVGEGVTATRVGDKIIVTIGGSGVQTIETTVDDSGGAEAYNGFPYPDKLSDNSIITGWKRSATHSDAGPFMMARTTDGGATWTKRQITVGGTPIDCASLSLKKIGLYVHISYQDDILYTSTKFARCLETDLITDFDNADFDLTETVNFLPDYTSAPFSQMVVLPSGKIYQPYYSVGINGEVGNCISGLIESTDNGANWAIGTTIYTQDTVSPVPGQIVTETAVAVVELGASDATTKLVAYMRNETSEFYTHAASLDGGATWTVDPINLFYSFGNQVARSPVAVILYEGLVYIICGRRNATLVYTNEYVTCSVADALTNNQSGYSANVVLPYTSNAQVNGAAIDFGYCEPFIDGNGELWIHFYDTSPIQDGGDRNCIIYQLAVVGGGGGTPTLEEVLTQGNDAGGEDIDGVGELTAEDVIVSNATASTPAFFSGAKRLITATGALLGTWINGLTAKATPVDADLLLTGDSAASNESKKTTFLQAWNNYFKIKSTYIFHSNNVSSSFTGNTNENISDSILIPAGTLSANDVLSITAVYTKTGTAGTLIVRLSANTSAAVPGTRIGILGNAAANLWYKLNREVIFKNSLTSQTVFGNAVASAPSDIAQNSNALSALTIDFSVDQYIIVSGQLSNGADTGTFQGWEIEIRRRS